MGRSTTITHAVNGYSRYDLPESKAFSCTPGILYPVRIDFINARDRVSISQGIDVRSNPLAVPTFNPYTIRLHRFWVPMQLYHAEMRTNSSKFDMNNVSLNWIPLQVGVGNQVGSVSALGSVTAYPNSLMAWLRHGLRDITTASALTGVSLSSASSDFNWVNADSYLAYWDIVRNYYSYSQWSLYSFAWPASWFLTTSASGYDAPSYGDSARYFSQRYGNLEFLDAYYESQFYPSSVSSTNNTFNRINLFRQIVDSDLMSEVSSASDGYPVAAVPSTYPVVGSSVPTSQFSLSGSGTSGVNSVRYFGIAHPMAVVPSSPDRFSRLVPYTTASDVSMAGINTIPQLAIASRMQEYKDLLGAGGSRYSDWLDTFFASKIEHVDRPKLLFSASQTVNVQVVMNTAGNNNFDYGSLSGDNSLNGPLGQQGGAIAFNAQLGRRQSYYFREPGYLIDMLSIRPVYYWTGIMPDYAHYRGADYFNPIYNDIGFQDVPFNTLGYTSTSGSLMAVMAMEPCFNEFRSSYDEVLGQLSASQGNINGIPLYSYWVQQRSLSLFNPTSGQAYYPALFVDMTQVNSPFASKVEDNFFVNISYSVQKKSLVNKTFATRLSNR